jgi:hypothetical protein
MRHIENRHLALEGEAVLRAHEAEKPDEMPPDEPGTSSPTQLAPGRTEPNSLAGRRPAVVRVIGPSVQVRPFVASGVGWEPYAGGQLNGEFRD